MYLHGGNLGQIARDFALDPSRIIDFSSNINPLGLPGKVLSIIKTQYKQINSYPDIDYFQTKQGISKYCRIDFDQIILGNGAIELIYLLVYTLKPKKVLLVAPTFCEYERALMNEQSKIDYFVLSGKNNFQLNSDHLLAQLKNNYQLIILCNPNNPTSSFIDPGIIKKITHEAEKYQTFLLLDESFIDFIGHEQSVLKQLSRNEKNIILLRSMTKFFAMPGLRLGYAILFNPALMEKLEKKQYPWNVNVFSAAIGAKLYQQEKFIRQTKKIIDRERIYLYEQLNHLPNIQPYPGQANFILFKLKQMQAAWFQKELLSTRIWVRNACNFNHLSGQHIRIAVKKRKQNQYLIKQIKRLTNS